MIPCVPELRVDPTVTRRSRLGHGINGPCKPEIVIAYSANVVCYQINYHPVVDVGPFGVVVHLLGLHCDSGHKAKSLDKPRELKLLVKLAVHYLPSDELG